jgi:phosphohistidine phosphatase
MSDSKTLHLLRHAKSSWDNPDLADHDRPLAPRGRRNAAALATHFSSAGISPALILCSSAQRARETLAGVLPGLHGEAEIRIEDGLYGAGAEALIARIRDVPEATPSVLVIGHNPGLEDLATRLDGRAPAAPLPTAALATFELSGGWRTLSREGAILVDRYTPRGARAD